MIMSVDDSNLERRQCLDCKFTVLNFVVLCENSEKLLNFLYDHGVLIEKRNCHLCGQEMRLTENRTMFWCGRMYKTVNSRRKKISMRCRGKVSLFHDTFMSNHKLPLKKICRLIALWVCLPPPRQHIICEEVGVSALTCIEFSAQLQQASLYAVRYLHHEKIGGEGKIVEIVEAEVDHNKHVQGQFFDANWVYGGVERGSDGCFFIGVPAPGSEVLLQIIKDHILPKTTVYSECFKSYDCLETEGYQDLTVNHSMKFSDPDKGFRFLYGYLKRNGIRKNHRAAHLAEYVFKTVHPNHTKRIHAIFTAIGQLYNVDQNMEVDSVDIHGSDSDNEKELKTTGEKDEGPQSTFLSKSEISKFETPPQ